ncbi:glycosyltransferase family 2 protein [Candidatus Chloroploca sp. Khr17]|uniref:glycosyltransferase family 2 protein n=1 Tax=Candidatus Chloroploca sp. Khr17 TaxID=2496869 RepID=UPI00101BF943|nr:glycosyltransferase family 2 protein [Candidatus Chloroploca sp. Khr17]
MKLIVQIPALNERETIAAVIADVPRTIPGISAVEVLVIDDGCTDDTVTVALRAGADHVVRHTANKGLANAYQTGIDTALRLGADLIVNTDADHQYPGREIATLVQPIIQGKADIVVGDRQVQHIEHFSPLKKTLQHLGSSVVRWASETDVPDTVSGFRALTREAALRTFVTTDFSYTIEALIQAGKRRLTIVAVPITTNYVERPSRLHRGNWNFIKRQAAIIARTYATHEPLKVFSYLAAFLFTPGALLLIWAFYIFLGRRMEWFVQSRSNDQSLLVGSILILMALFVFLIGLLADLVGGVRRIQQEVLYRVRTIQVDDEAWRRNASARLDALETALTEESAPTTPKT